MTDYTKEIHDRANYCDRVGMNGTAHILREYAGMLECAPEWATLQQPSKLPATEINALPERVRRYIIWLETNTDPAETLSENFRLAKENAALRILAAEQSSAPAVRFRPVSDEDVNFIGGLLYPYWSIMSANGRDECRGRIRAILEKLIPHGMPVVDAQQPNGESAEPVAWLHKHGSRVYSSKRQLDLDEVARGWTQEPLYTHPPTRSEQLSEPSTDTPK